MKSEMRIPSPTLRSVLDSRREIPMRMAIVARDTSDFRGRQSAAIQNKRGGHPGPDRGRRQSIPLWPPPRISRRKDCQQRRSGERKGMAVHAIERATKTRRAKAQICEFASVRSVDWRTKSFCQRRDQLLFNRASTGSCNLRWPTRIRCNHSSRTLDHGAYFVRRWSFVKQGREKVFCALFRREELPDRKRLCD